MQKLQYIGSIKDLRKIEQENTEKGWEEGERKVRICPLLSSSFFLSSAFPLPLSPFIYSLFILLPWVPEVFLACSGNFRCWPKADTSSAVGRSHERVTIKTWQKTETALEKSLAPRVLFCRLWIILISSLHLVSVGAGKKRAWENAWHEHKWIQRIWHGTWERIKKFRGQ